MCSKHNDNAKYCYAECHPEFHKKSLYAECHCAEFRYTECRYDKCNGAILLGGGGTLLSIAD
jgi:hypothetical protein